MRGELRNMLIGAALMVAAMQFTAVNDGLAKLLTHSLPVMVVVFLRSFTQFCLLGVAIVARRALVPRRILLSRAQILRGFLWWFATFLFFISLQRYDIPSALSLFMVGPLFIALTAPLLLKERFDWRLVGAAALGFVGALVIIRPGFAEFRPLLLLPLFAGISYSLYLMVTRHVSLDRSLGAEQIAMCASLWASVFALPLGLYYWESLTAGQLGIAFGMGACAALGHVFIALSCQRIDASKVAPYHYTELAGAVVVSYLLFGDLPDAWVWLGMALVACGGVWSALATRRRLLEIDPVV